MTKWPAAAVGEPAPPPAAARSSPCCRSSSRSCCSACSRRCAARFALGRRLAGADRLMTHAQDLDHPAAAAAATWSGSARCRACRASTSIHWFGGIYQDERRRRSSVYVCDPAALHGASTRSSSCRRRQREAWLADRQGADRRAGHRGPLRLEGRRPDSAALGDLPPARRRRHLGVERGRRSTTSPRKRRRSTRPVPLPLRLLRRVVARRAATASAGCVVRVADPAQIDRGRAAIDALFANSPSETKTSTEKALAQRFADQIGNIGAIITGDRRRGVLHDAAGHRQHHGAVGARAHRRDSRC